MAIAVDNDGQVKWDTTANSKSISSGSNYTSDEFSANGAMISGHCNVKVDNNGTPASGDTVEIKILRNCGDPDADPDSADEFETPDAVPVAAVLDTNAADPQLKSIPIAPCKGYKVWASNNASSNAQTVSANHTEQTST